MYKTSVDTLVNGNIDELAHRKQQKSQKVILPASHWVLSCCHSFFDTSHTRFLTIRRNTTCIVALGLYLVPALANSFPVFPHFQSALRDSVIGSRVVHFNAVSVIAMAYSWA